MNKNFKIISRELFPKIKYKNIKNPPSIIAFFGVPGSGKTYISKILERKYKAVRISSHDILEIIDRNKSEKNAKENYNVKQEFIYNLISKAPFKNKRVILDKGIDREYPRLLKIFESKKLPYFLIRLKIDKEEAIKRINKRRVQGKWLIKAMNKWQDDWKSAKKRINSHVFLYEPKPNLKELYSKLDKLL